MPAEPTHPREAGRHRVRQARLAALQDEDAVRGIREDPRVAAEREAIVRERLQPAFDDVVLTRPDRPEVLKRGRGGEQAARHYNHENEDKCAHGHLRPMIV